MLRRTENPTGRVGVTFFKGLSEMVGVDCSFRSMSGTYFFPDK